MAGHAPQDAIAAEVDRWSWWVLWGPLPQAPYIRAVISVDPSRPADYGPAAVKRTVFAYSAEARNEPDAVEDLVDRIATMDEAEFRRLMDEGRILPLSVQQ